MPPLATAVVQLPAAGLVFVRIWTAPPARSPVATQAVLLEQATPVGATVRPVPFAVHEPLPNVSVLRRKRSVPPAATHRLAVGQATPRSPSVVPLVAPAQVAL